MRNATNSSALLSIFVLTISLSLATLAQKNSVVFVTPKKVNPKNINPENLKQTEAGALCATCPTAASVPTPAAIKTDSENINAELKPRFADATFYWDLKSDVAQQTISTDSKSSKLSLNTLEATQISDLHQQAFNATDYTSFLALLNANKDMLTDAQKITFLSMLGQKMAQGYSSTTTQNTNMQSLFLNAQLGTRTGGICGDISTFLTQSAKALGFDNIGIMSSIWQRDSLQKTGLGHAIAYFRNPKTGEYYIQNYSTIFNTHQKDSKSAVEIATRAMGIITGTSNVQSPNGVVHVYIPQTSNWVKGLIQAQTQFASTDSKVVMRLGKTEQFFGVQGTMQDGHSRASAFAFRNQIETNAGPYTLDVAGLASSETQNNKLINKIIDEVHYTSNVYGGYQHLSGPVIRFDGPSQKGSQGTVFIGGGIHLAAKVNSTTVKIEGNMHVNYKDFRFVETKSGVIQDISKQVNLPVKVEAERVWHLTPRSDTLNTPYALKTAYDRVGVIYDPAASKNKYYLKVGADFLLLEGADKMSAQAVRTYVKANVPTEKLGEFSVYVDASKMLKNPAKDPFYESGVSLSMKTEWKKKLDSIRFGREKSEIGAFINVTKGNTIQAFGVLGGTVTTPQFQGGASTTKRLLFYFNQPM